jgi:hypothetical protein
MKIDGCLYDVLRKPALRPLEANKKRTEPEKPDAFLLRCAEAIVEKPHDYYQRGEVVRLDAELDEARFDVWQLARQLREAELAKRYPRNPDACLRYGRTCAFFGVCTGEASLEDPALFRRATNAHEELPESTAALPILSSTRAKDARACQRLHKYKFLDGYRPAEEAEPLRFGSLVHEGLKGWWLAPTDRLTAAMAAIGGEAEPYDRARAEAMLRGYDARWLEDTVLYDVLAVEEEFSTPLVNPETGSASRTWTLGGKVDAIVREKATGRVLLVEHKTTSEAIGPGSEYWRRLRIDAQVSIYFDGAAAILSRLGLSEAA